MRDNESAWGRREPPKEWEIGLTTISTEVEELGKRVRGSAGDKTVLGGVEERIAALAILLVDEDKKLEARVAAACPALDAIEQRRAELDASEHRLLGQELRLAGAQRLLAKFADDVAKDAGRTEEALAWLQGQEASETHFAHLQQLEYEHAAFMISLLDPDSPPSPPLPKFVPYEQWVKKQHQANGAPADAPGDHEKALVGLLAKIRRDPPPRTNRTRGVPPPVLIGHAVSLPPY